MQCATFVERAVVRTHVDYSHALIYLFVIQFKHILNNIIMTLFYNFTLHATDLK